MKRALLLAAVLVLAALAGCVSGASDSADGDTEVAPGGGEYVGSVDGPNGDVHVYEFPENGDRCYVHEWDGAIDCQSMNETEGDF